jgi:hypothetical protein
MPFKTFVSLTILFGLCAPGWPDAEICVSFLDMSYAPTTVFDGDTDVAPVPGCTGDFILVLQTSDATDLSTYSQQITYDPDVIQYVGTDMGCAYNPLPTGFGQEPGNVVVDTADKHLGDLYVVGTGISGQTGPEELVWLIFEVVCGPTSDSVTVADHPGSTAPYADVLTQNIPHTHCSPVPFSTINAPGCLSVSEWDVY